ncbi:MAG: hypothetical protein WEB60_08275 [Terrimicrobiaceae bacterium]
MNSRKNALWKQIDDATKKSGVSRATLYRWMSDGRLTRKTVDGFTFVDLYAVAELARGPRRSRGRKLAIQKAKSKRVEHSRRPDNYLTVFNRFAARMARYQDHNEISPMVAQAVMLPRLRSMIADLEKIAKG